MKRGWMWPVGIAAALLFTVGANVVMLMAASSDANGSVVEPDYYRKAVEWDRTLARRAESDRLGWVARATIGALRPAADGETHATSRTVRVSLVDSLGASVRGADVAVTMIHNGDAAHPVRAALAHVADGSYESALAIPRRGLWEVRVEARDGTQRFAASLRVEAP